MRRMNGLGPVAIASVLWLAWATRVQAAEAPALPALSAEVLVAKNVAARGGLEAWRTVSSIAYRGTLDAGVARPDNGLNPGSRERLIEKPAKRARPGEVLKQQTVDPAQGTPVTLPYTLLLQRPLRQRVEIKFKDQTLVQVYDGAQGWKLQPYLNRGGAMPFSEEEQRQAKDFQPLDGPLIDYKQKGTAIALDGTEVVDGQPAYRLALHLKDGSTRHIWLDSKTYLDVQIDGSRRLNGRTVPVYTVQRDFRRVQGLVLPYLIETRTEGLPEREKILITEVTINPHVDDNAFAKPQ